MYISLSLALSLSLCIYIYTGVPCKECILKIRFSLNFSSSTRTSYHVETWMCHPALTLIFFCVGPVFPGSSHLPEKRHVGKLHKLQTWVWVSKLGWFWLAGPQLQSTSSKWPWMTVISNIESSKFSSADQVGVVQVRRSLPWPLVRSFCAAFIWIPLKCPQQNSLSSTNLQGRGHGLELCLNDCGSDHAEQVSCVENVCVCPCVCVLVLCVCWCCVCVRVFSKAHFWCAIHQCSSRIHFPLAAVGLERYSIKRTKNRLGKHHLSLFHGSCLLSLLWRLLMTIDDSFTPKALTGWTLAWWLCGQSELVPS